MFVRLSKCQAEVLTPTCPYLGIKAKMTTQARCCLLLHPSISSNIELPLLFQKSSKIHNTEDRTTGYCICSRKLYSASLIALLLFAPKKLHKLHALHLSCDFIMLHEIFHPQSILHIFMQINTLIVNVVVFI